MIAGNRLLNRLKYKSPDTHLHMARSFIIKISNLRQTVFLYFPITRIIAQTDRRTDRQMDRQSDGQIEEHRYTNNMVPHGPRLRGGGINNITKL